MNKRREKEYVTEIYHEENQLVDKYNQKNDQYFQLFQEMFQLLLLHLMNQLENKLLEVLVVYNHLFEKIIKFFRGRKKSTNTNESISKITLIT